MQIERILKNRNATNIIVLHVVSVKPIEGVKCRLVDYHNRARDMAYIIAKKNDLKCECVEDQPDIISGHILLINHDGCYAAIVIDTKMPFTKKDVDSIPGARFMPRHWTERSAKDLQNKEKPQESRSVKQLTEGRFSM